jgi:hypothetical protein
MPREHISPILLAKLKNWFRITLDTNNDGVINWKDFEAAVEVIDVFFSAIKQTELDMNMLRML